MMFWQQQVVLFLRPAIMPSPSFHYPWRTHYHFSLSMKQAYAAYHLVAKEKGNNVLSNNNWSNISRRKRLYPIVCLSEQPQQKMKQTACGSYTFHFIFFYPYHHHSLATFWMPSCRVIINKQVKIVMLMCICIVQSTMKKRGISCGIKNKQTCGRGAQRNGSTVSLVSIGNWWCCLHILYNAHYLGTYFGSNHSINIRQAHKHVCK